MVSKRRNARNTKAIVKVMLFFYEMSAVPPTHNFADPWRTIIALICRPLSLSLSP